VTQRLLNSLPFGIFFVLFWRINPRVSRGKSRCFF